MWGTIKEMAGEILTLQWVCKAGINTQTSLNPKILVKFWGTHLETEKTFD